MKKISGVRFLMRDGRVFERRRASPPVPLSMPPMVDISEELAISSSGEVWYLGVGVTDDLPTVVPGGRAERLIGRHHAVRADGSIIAVYYRSSFSVLEDYSGATSCVLGACLVKGNLWISTKWWGGAIEMEGRGVEVAAGTIRRKDGLYEQGFAVLREDGVVVHVPYSTVAADPQITLLEGPPAVAHLRGLDGSPGPFYADRGGGIWYAGVRIAVPGLTSLALAPEFPCTFYRPGGRPAWAGGPLALEPTRCIGPVEIVELRGATVECVSEDALYALYPDGKVLCWGTSCYPAQP